MRLRWRAVFLMGAGLWAIAAFAQFSPEIALEIAPPERSGISPWILRKLLGNDRPARAPVCSVPMVEVPATKAARPRMRILRPPKPVEPMPLVPLPASPCQEKKR